LTMDIRNSNTYILYPMFLMLFLYLHHKYNRFENTLFFSQLHLSNSVIKKRCLYVEKYWGACICPSLHPSCYAYAVNITLFWVMTPCILVEWYQCFIGCKQVVEAAESSEDAVYLQQTARFYVSEDSNIFI